MEAELLSFGNGGWVRWQSSGLDGAAVYVRFTDVDDRLVPVEVFIDGSADGNEHALDTDTLRSIPLGRLKESVNVPDNARYVRASRKIPGPQLSVAASYFSATFGRKRPAHWVAQMLEGDPIARGATAKPVPRPRPPDATLKSFRPDAARQTPEFYVELANLVTELKTWTHHPKPLIADANRVTLRQVQTWVQKAQRDGLLPSKQRKAD